MCPMTDRILVFMVWLPKGNAIIGKYPISIIIRFTFGGGYGFEKR
jgi:hypothetical protein